MGKGKAYVQLDGTLYRMKRKQARRMLKHIAEGAPVTSDIRITPKQYGAVAVAGQATFMRAAVDQLGRDDAQHLLELGLFAKKEKSPE